MLEFPHITISLSVKVIPEILASHFFTKFHRLHLVHQHSMGTTLSLLPERLQPF